MSNLENGYLIIKFTDHSRAYYVTRSIVRGLFWLATATIAAAAFIASVWILWAVMG